MNTLLGKIGFFISSSAYFISFIFLFLTNTTFIKKNLFTLSLLSTAVYLTLSVFIISFQLDYFYILISETWRNIIWMIILIDILKGVSKNNQVRLIFKSKMTKVIILTFIPLIELICYSVYKNAIIIFILHLLQTIFIMLFIEQLYKKTNKSQRWKIKPLCIGLGLVYVYDFAFYSDALLFHHLDVNILFVKGWILLFALPLILMTASRIKNKSIRFYISRDIAFSSTLLIVSGFYLAFMSCVGYLIRYLDYSWSYLVQHLFFATSFIVFSILFLSNQLRIKLKKFIVLHFYENKYDYRQEWLSFSKSLENKNESAYQIALHSMINPFSCETGVLFEVKSNKIITKARHNIKNPLYLDLLNSLSIEALKKKTIINLREISKETKDPSTQYKIEKIIQRNKFIHVIPITEHGDAKYVCMLSKINQNTELDFEDEDLINVLSKQLSISLNLHLANEYLIENKQFNTFNQMSTFLVHDLKNILAQLELLSKNSKRHKENKSFIADTFITIDSASNRLNKVLSQLVKHKPQEYNYESVNIKDALTQAYKERKHFHPKPTLDCNFDHSILIKTDKEKLINIFLNLIKNAQDACDKKGKVYIYHIPNNEYFGIGIKDNGTGMTEEFIANRLFKPFETTKGNAGLGVGAYDAKKFIEQMNGQLEVTSCKGKGSTFEIYLPLHKENV